MRARKPATVVMGWTPPLATASSVPTRKCCNDHLTERSVRDEGYYVESISHRACVRCTAVILVSAMMMLLTDRK